MRLGDFNNTLFPPKKNCFILENIVCKKFLVSLIAPTSLQSNFLIMFGPECVCARAKHALHKMVSFSFSSIIGTAC